MFRFILFILALERVNLRIFQNCNPVPIPGVAMLTSAMHRCGTSRQQTLHDFPGFDITGHQGEGCNRSTTVAEADPWVQEFCNIPAKCGQPPPLSYGSRQHALPSTVVQKRSYRRACNVSQQNLRYSPSRSHGFCMLLPGIPVSQPSLGTREVWRRAHSRSSRNGQKPIRPMPLY